MDDDLAEGGDALETTGEPEDVPLTPRGGGASPTELLRYAQEYEPDFVESTMNSLIELLAEQSVDCRVLSGFQEMILRHPLTPDRAEIFHILAARNDVSTEVIDAVLWMWCGGACVDEALQKMCSDATRAGRRGGSLRRKESLWVLRATNLLKKDRFMSDPYCCAVRASAQHTGDQEEPQSGMEWSFDYRVADRMSLWSRYTSSMTTRIAPIRWGV